MTSTGLSIFPWVFSLTITTLNRNYYYHSYFTNQETEIKYLSQSSLERGSDQVFIRVLKFQSWAAGDGGCSLPHLAHWPIEQVRQKTEKKYGSMESGTEKVLPQCDYYDTNFVVEVLPQKQ